MFKISKINLVLIFLIIFVLLSGFFAVKWAQKEIKMRKFQLEVKTEKGIEEGVENKKADVTITDVTIITDKTEYKQGETVKIFIENNSDKVIFGGYCLPELGIWELEKFERDKWINLRSETIRGLWLPKLENGKEYCKSHYSPEQPLCRKRWGPYSEISHEWNQKICPHHGDPPVLIEKGIYRLVFIYGSEIYGGWFEAGSWYGKIKDPKIIYSNTFTIK